MKSKEVVYVIPKILRRPGIFLQYDVVRRKRDMRCRFCKQFAGREVDEVQLLQLMSEMGLVFDGTFKPKIVCSTEEESIEFQMRLLELQQKKQNK